jgi:hypothetical protein
MIRKLQHQLWSWAWACTLAFVIQVIFWAYGLGAAIGASLSLFVALAIWFIVAPLFKRRRVHR